MADGIVLAGKFSEALLDKNVSAWVGQGMQKQANRMPYYKQVAYHTTTNQELFKIMDGVERGQFEETPENGKPHEATDLPGFTTTFNVRDFSMMKTISKQAGRADESNHRQKTDARISRSVGEGYIKKLNEDVADVVRNGFDTSFTSYGDGKPFFSTIHDRIDGGSTIYRSNASSTGVTLGYDNLKVGRLAIRQVVDGEGAVIDHSHMPLELIVGPELEDVAYEAIGTNRHLYNTTSADFTPNALQANGQIRVTVNPLLGAAGGGSATAWYLHVADLGEDDPIKVYHRQFVRMKSRENFYTDKHEIKGTAAYAIGWTDPIGFWWGTRGDELAYAS